MVQQPPDRPTPFDIEIRYRSTVVIVASTLAIVFGIVGAFVLAGWSAAVSVIIGAIAGGFITFALARRWPR